MFGYDNRESYATEPVSGAENITWIAAITGVLEMVVDDMSSSDTTV